MSEFFDENLCEFFDGLPDADRRLDDGLLRDCKERIAQFQLEQGATWTAHAGGIAKIERDLPQSHPFDGRYFYVRACFPAYVDYILRSWAQGFRSVTLTGSPGIGKSVFYIFFAHLFIQRNPNVTVITAAFTAERKLIECVVFAPGEEPRREKELIRDTESAIYLIDGIPDLIPRQGRMVAFTSPDKSWYSLTARDPYHICLYFPRWELDELEQANAELKLGVTDLEQREKFLGGSARYCLAPNQLFFENEKKIISTRISNIGTFKEVVDILSTNKDIPDAVGDRVFATIPVTLAVQRIPTNALVDLPASYKREFASAIIAQLVDDRINSRTEDERMKLVDWFRGAPHTEVLLGGVFERSIRNGIPGLSSMSLRPLSEAPNTSPFELERGDIKYKHMENSNFPSIDGVLTTQKIVFLVQITRNYTHPVGAEGILSYLESTNDVSRLDRNEIALLFVVPKGMGERFKAQRITSSGSNFSEDSPVTAVPGIGHHFAKFLRESSLQICTVGQLRSAIEDGQVEQVARFKAGLRKYDELRKQAANLERIVQLPQYVFESAIDIK